LLDAADNVVAGDEDIQKLTAAAAAAVSMISACLVRDVLTCIVDAEDTLKAPDAAGTLAESMLVEDTLKALGNPLGVGRVLGDASVLASDVILFAGELAGTRESVEGDRCRGCQCQHLPPARKIVADSDSVHEVVVGVSSVRV
jgi:hypothetical protein